MNKENRLDFKAHPYQSLIIDPIINQERNLILADCGVGKTPCTLVAAQDLMISGEVEATLIIAPVRVVRMVWPREMEKWTFTRGMEYCNLRDLVVSANTKAQQAKQELAKKQFHNGTSQIYLINYENLPKLIDYMRRNKIRIKFNHVVFDEITKAKKHDNAYLAPFKTIIAKFTHRTGLTGSIMPHSYMDLFGQVLLLDGGKALDHRITYFRKKYFDKDEYIKGVYHLREGAAHQIDCAISHLTTTVKAEDHIDVVKADYIDVPVTLPKQCWPKYRELEKELITNIDGDDPVEVEIGDRVIVAESRLVLSNKLRQFVSGNVYDEDRLVMAVHTAKLEALGKLLKKIKTPVLIATSFTHEVTEILKAYPELEKFKESDMDRWQAGKIRGWVSNAKSISHGIDGLQLGGHIVIWYSPTYSWDDTHQFNSRITGGLRAGQATGVPQVYRLITTDTIEEAIIEVVSARQSNELAFQETMKKLEMFRRIT